MSKKAETITFWLLLATCSAVLIQPGQAQLPPPLVVLPAPIPGLLPPKFPVDIQQCWSTLTTVPDCIWEIYRSFFSAQFGNIGPDCCKAFTAINDKCWPKMFPLNPFFPPLLKDSCARLAPVAPGPK